MRKVFKYALTGPETILDMPKGAVVLHVGEQGDGRAPCLWALVIEDAPTERRGFYVYGTGHEVDVGIVTHIGTWFSLGGQLVWHLFERAVLQTQQVNKE